jgi:mRNA interferase MazF
MKQSEIWLIDLDPTKGAEIQKKRPAIIINDDTLGKLPLKVVIPITDWKLNQTMSTDWLKLLLLIVFRYVHYQTSD